MSYLGRGFVRLLAFNNNLLLVGFVKIRSSRHLLQMASLFKLKPVEKVELVPKHLVKEIVMKGTGESPVKGNTVTCHYTGVLTNGEKFDSSRDRGKPFQFKIGIGQVITAWDLGIASMKIGERAVLTSSSEYAYGEDGAPPVIPPNSTLVFDVELIKISK